jgi:thiol:disulfide interchange protein DsbD
MYLFGKIRLSHDAPIENIGVFRFLLGLSSLIFAVYMLPGLWGAPLKIISGFPPPQKYSESPFGVGYTAGTTMEALPKGAEYGPNNIVVFTDYDVAMAYAKKVNKPLMLDFTGKACQNCRKMEENVWSDKKVLSKLKNDVVLVSLYVDQDTPLPKDKQHISKFSGDEIITIGDKWLEFQTYVYKDLSQPMYVIIDHEENKLNNQVHYMPDVIKYEEWLQKGIDNFNKQK